MGALENAMNEEQERSQQWGIGMDPLDGDHDTVERGRYNYLRELLRRMRMHDDDDAERENSESDSIPDLETIPPASPRSPSPDYFAMLDDDNSIDFETAFGMRVTEREEKLFAVEEIKGQRAAMGVTGKAKPQPLVPSKCITIEVTVNGLRAVILLDTGSSINAMSPSVALLSNTDALPL
ncbi:hypothetical protein BC629DRAFT_1597354 [Irpex lacteus]|nr:hypothetical protein BC629DRAFT_1597354 [Irpex lacteus]